MNATETIRSEFKEQLLSQFEQQISLLPGDKELRKKAASYFGEKGFPTRKWEDYKYVNPEAILRKGFGFRTEMMRGVTANDVKEFTLVKDAIVVVIVNGKFIPELSQAQHAASGITISSIT